MVGHRYVVKLRRNSKLPLEQTNLILLVIIYKVQPLEEIFLPNIVL